MMLLRGAEEAELRYGKTTEEEENRKRRRLYWSFPLLHHCGFRFIIWWLLQSVPSLIATMKKQVMKNSVIRMNIFY